MSEAPVRIVPSASFTSIVWVVIENPTWPETRPKRSIVAVPDTSSWVSASKAIVWPTSLASVTTSGSPKVWSPFRSKAVFQSSGVAPALSELSPTRQRVDREREPRDAGERGAGEVGLDAEPRVAPFASLALTDTIASPPPVTWNPMPPAADRRGS